jgi:hypothetical protein
MAIFQAAVILAYVSSKQDKGQAMPQGDKRRRSSIKTPYS